MMQLRYSGEFLSRGGVRWKANIMQESSTPYTVGELEFDADEALTIDWEAVNKEDVMCGSVATLHVISPGDRTYQGLYTIKPGNIRLDVYRNGALYWSGCLDPEFYEEPYEQAANYDVMLTFSDFGIMDRLKYQLIGQRTLKEIVDHALQLSKLNYTKVDTALVTTTFEDGAPITGGGISIRSDNFTDEDGEVSTLKEVLEGIMQPLALRMVQRNGAIYIYDLNGLYTAGSALPITWTGDSQTMGVDRVANNVKVTFSPYSNAKLMDEEVIEYTDKYDTEKVNFEPNANFEPGYGKYYSIRPTAENPQHGEKLNDVVDFTVFLGQGKGVTLPPTSIYAQFFHILPVQGDAPECSGIAYRIRYDGNRIDGSRPGYDDGWYAIGKDFATPQNASSPYLFETKKVFLPKLAEADQYNLRLSLSIMIDARYNPFSDEDTDNYNEDNQYAKAISGWVFVPISVTLRDDNGKALYHYSNEENARMEQGGNVGLVRGKWLPGEDPGGHAWLQYYNPEDLQEDAGIGTGWGKNKHCVGRRDKVLAPRFYKSFLALPDGEYLPYPPVAGHLEVKVREGVNGYDCDRHFDPSEFGGNNTAWHTKGIYSRIRWVMYKAPELEVVKDNRTLSEAELADVEYSALINKDADEEVSIDTVCGTAEEICPTAKGLYYRTSTGQQFFKLKRAGLTDHPEKLLIGTIYSQLADRKTALSGEAAINGGLHCYTERNQGQRKFMLMGESQNVITDCTEAQFCEFRPDEYTEKKQ